MISGSQGGPPKGGEGTSLVKIQRKRVLGSGYSKHQVLEVGIRLACSLNSKETSVAETVRRQWWKMMF